jgi:PAS domain S-box-containing protein
MRAHRAARWFWVSLPIVAIAFGAWFYSRQSTPLPRKSYRIGFEQNPPYHFLQPDGSPGGIAYEVVSEAAQRAGIQLEWVQHQESSEAALRSGQVDLWPLVTDLPERRKSIYISRPWLQTDHFLVIREGKAVPDHGFTGDVGCGGLPLHARLIRQHFPRARSIPFPSHMEVVKAVCTGQLEVGFLGAAPAMEALRAGPPECAAVPLQAYALSDLRLKQGVGSTFEARAAADRIRDEIDFLARNGRLAGTLVKYSFFSIDETSATYEVLVVRERAKWLSLGVVVLTLALAFAVWLSTSLYKARKRADEANVLKEEFITRYAMAARATNDAIWDWNLQTDQVSWHEGAYTLFGYSAQEVGTDMTWRNERIHPEDRDRVVQGLRNNLFRGEQKWSDEYRFLSAKGSYAFVEDRGYVMYDASHRPVRMIGAMMDVTPRRNLEQQLSQSHKMEAVGQLAGGVAHDFNNLLTAILGYATVLLSQLPAGDPAREDLRQIEQAAQRAADLTQQLLAFSRRQVLQPRVLRLQTVIGEMESLLRRLIAENIEIKMVTAPELGCVKADKGQISQVILNLCLNARDAMPHGGLLTIETSNVALDEAYAATHVGVKPGSYILLAVTDTGQGMDAETQQRIFEPFFTTKQAGKGTGLGLATIYGIVQQSGGSIWVDSAPGSGSTFKIYLPRVECIEALPETGPRNLNTRRGTETILLVEDEPSVRQLAARLLKQEGYKVLEAQSGQHALQMYREYAGRIHLVFTDVVMPGMDGSALAARLKLLHPGLKVLFMSGYAENAEVHHEEIGGGDAFLAKPFTPEVVLQRVRQVLDS